MDQRMISAPMTYLCLSAVPLGCIGRACVVPSRRRLSRPWCPAPKARLGIHALPVDFRRERNDLDQFLRPPEHSVVICGRLMNSGPADW